jgi:hypothetical protein
VALLPIAVPVLAPTIFKDLQYDAAHEFASPVTQIASYCFSFAVPAITLQSPSSLTLWHG